MSPNPYKSIQTIDLRLHHELNKNLQMITQDVLVSS